MDSTMVAYGTVITRDKIHGRTLAKNKIAVKVSELINCDKLVHPEYGYSVEAGGFTAWKLTQVRPTGTS